MLTPFEAVTCFSWLKFLVLVDVSTVEPQFPDLISSQGCLKQNLFFPIRDHVNGINLFQAPP